MITSTIEVDDPQGALPRLFSAEEKALLNDRASYTVVCEAGKTSIDAQARDATALRAVLNSICKVLVVHEKTSEL